MGIYIKGMKMPESCFYCRFRKKVNPDEIMCLATGEIFEETFTATIKMRNGAGKCPLVEVSEPHGDLIDRDTFRADYGMGENCDNCGIELKRCEYDRIYTKMDFCGWLDDAPTVIEAEGSEDNE